MDTASLTTIVSLLIALSIAAERVVEIVKGAWPWLNTQNADAAQEGWRKALLQALAVGAGILTAFLAQPAIKDVVPGWGEGSSVLALGFLASGGSGLWNSVLGYLTAVKDIKATAVKEAKAALAARTP
jgi:hypothetical protein